MYDNNSSNITHCSIILNNKDNFNTCTHRICLICYLCIMEVLRIKEIMFDKGVTGLELSNHLGVTPNSISLIINGKRQPRFETLIDIANYLGVDVGDLFVRTKERSNQDIAREIEELAREIK